jgi:RNA polymerase sigma factor (sigma-70 family)
VGLAAEPRIDSLPSVTSTAAKTPDSRPDRSPATSPGSFATTQWTPVLRAAGSDSQAHEALARLCQSYWYPLYTYVRRQGHDAPDAQDLTQEFFARMLERDWLHQVDPRLGRFRSFLLASLKHFLANERAKARTQKRGGAVPHVSLQLDSAEARFRHEPAVTSSPDKAYDRQWALTLLARALDRLQAECAASGKETLFATLKDALGGDRQSVRYGELGERLGLSETAVKVTVHRLRKRYRELLRAAIADTLVDGADVEEELRHLQAALSD